MAIVSLGDIPSLSVSAGSAADESLAQALGRRQSPIRASVIEAEAGVSASKAQMYARRQTE